MKHWGFGALKLKPDEFWEMSVCEFGEMLEAFVEEEKRQDDMRNQRTAWQTALIMTSSGNYKRPIQPTDLYKPIAYIASEEEPQQNIVERFESKKQKEEYLRNLMKKFGKEYKTDGS
jgi:hypothetical protein